MNISKTLTGEEAKPVLEQYLTDPTNAGVELVEACSLTADVKLKRIDGGVSVEVELPG